MQDLVDELLSHIASFLPTASLLVVFESVSVRHAALDTDAAWMALCVARWEDKPRYRLTAQRRQWLDAHMRTTWKRRYAHFELDAVRASITQEEMQMFGWYAPLATQSVRALGCAPSPHFALASEQVLQLYTGRGRSWSKHAAARLIQAAR